VPWDSPLLMARERTILSPSLLSPGREGNSLRIKFVLVSVAYAVNIENCEGRGPRRARNGLSTLAYLLGPPSLGPLSRSARANCPSRPCAPATAPQLDDPCRRRARASACSIFIASSTRQPLPPRDHPRPAGHFDGDQPCPGMGARIVPSETATAAEHDRRRGQHRERPKPPPSRNSNLLAPLTAATIPGGPAASTTYSFPATLDRPTRRSGPAFRPKAG